MYANIATWRDFPAGDETALKQAAERVQEQLWPRMQALGAHQLLGVGSGDNLVFISIFEDKETSMRAMREVKKSAGDVLRGLAAAPVRQSGRVFLQL